LQKYCERIFKKYLFGKIAFNFKIFFNFWKYLSQEYIRLEFLGKYYTVSNRVIFEKGNYFNS